MLPVIVFVKIIIITVMTDAVNWKPVISNCCGTAMTATNTREIKCVFHQAGIVHVCEYLFKSAVFKILF